MDEFMLGTGVVTPVPFAGRKGRSRGAEKCVYTLFQTVLQLLVVIGGLSEQVNIHQLWSSSILKQDL